MAKKNVDLRSDTVTKPSEEMRKAMYNAAVGDDVSQEDPTVNELEELAARMLGKEASLFVPSGTFGNQLALFTHCNRGNEVILHEDSHIVQHEAGGASIIASVQLRTVTSESGFFRWSDIDNKVRKSEDIHYPKTGLIVVQNSLGNGSTVPLDILGEIKEKASAYGIPVHMDGARIFNAAEYLKTDVKEIAKQADSVMFCLSKGLCSPIGSILAGDKNFIDKARKNRKIMGGGMRQAGVLAAPGIISLKKMTLRLGEDHEKAQILAKEFANHAIFEIFPENVHTNIFYLKFRGEKEKLSSKFYSLLSENGILVYPPRNGEIRFVTHADISFDDINYVCAVVRKIAENV